MLGIILRKVRNVQLAVADFQRWWSGYANFQALVVDREPIQALNGHLRVILPSKLDEAISQAFLGRSVRHNLRGDDLPKFDEKALHITCSAELHIFRPVQKPYTLLPSMINHRYRGAGNSR